VREALIRGVIDEALPFERAAAESDLIYLAQPIRRILERIEAVDQHVRPGTLITDAGSTKAAIVERAAQRIKRGRFVGGHPMAGKESRGVAEAEADLFRGHPYVLTSADATLSHWIERMGARVLILAAEEHDRLVALTSHVPQLVSTALALAIAGEPGAERVAGPSAVGMTRLALSTYEIWGDIFATNAGPIDTALEAFIRKLEELRRKLGQPGIEREFEHAAAAARGLRPKK
jgi:prephenate dehydrogenase